MFPKKVNVNYYKCDSATDEGIRKIWYVHIVEYYLTRRMKSCHLLSDLHNILYRHWGANQCRLREGSHIPVREAAYGGGITAIWTPLKALQTHCRRIKIVPSRKQESHLVEETKVGVEGQSPREKKT
jgi:hypothetical protein